MFPLLAHLTPLETPVSLLFLASGIVLGMLATLLVVRKRSR